jgi:NADH-quinone oxidoreductase subunit I
MRELQEPNPLPPMAAAVQRPLVKRRRLSLAEKSFVIPFAKALWFTFTRMFHRKATRQYPEQKLEPGATFHGVPVLVARDDGAPRCVACGLCEFVCPPRAIDITPGETDRDIERAPQEFVIDMLRCIECSYCEEVCPEEAIVMSQDYELVGRRREDFVWRLPQLLRPVSALQDRIDFIRKIYRRWDATPGDQAPPDGGVYRDPRWAGREKPVEHH